MVGQTLHWAAAVYVVTGVLHFFVYLNLRGSRFVQTGLTNNSYYGRGARINKNSLEAAAT